MRKIIILFPFFAACFCAKSYGQVALTDAQAMERLLSSKWVLENAQVVPKGEMTQKTEAFVRNFSQEQAQTFRNLEFTPDGKMIVNGQLGTNLNFNVEKEKLVVVQNNEFNKEGETIVIAFDLHFSDSKTLTLRRPDANHTYIYTFKAQ
jgi:hypothetical protein